MECIKIGILGAGRFAHVLPGWVAQADTFRIFVGPPPRDLPLKADSRRDRTIASR